MGTVHRMTITPEKETELRDRMSEALNDLAGFHAEAEAARAEDDLERVRDMLFQVDRASSEARSCASRILVARRHDVQVTPGVDTLWRVWNRGRVIMETDSADDAMKLARSLRS